MAPGGQVFEMQAAVVGAPRNSSSWRRRQHRLLLPVGLGVVAPPQPRSLQQGRTRKERVITTDFARTAVARKQGG